MSQNQPYVPPVGIHAGAGIVVGAGLPALELLAMHVELAELFREELRTTLRRDSGKTSEAVAFFRGKIEQHETAATALRAQFNHHAAGYVAKSARTS